MTSTVINDYEDIRWESLVKKNLPYTKDELVTAYGRWYSMKHRHENNPSFTLNEDWCRFSDFLGWLKEGCGDAGISILEKKLIGRFTEDGNYGECNCTIASRTELHFIKELNKFLNEVTTKGIKNTRLIKHHTLEAREFILNNKDITVDFEIKLENIIRKLEESIISTSTADINNNLEFTVINNESSLYNQTCKFVREGTPLKSGEPSMVVDFGHVRLRIASKHLKKKGVEVIENSQQTSPSNRGVEDSNLAQIIRTKYNSERIFQVFNKTYDKVELQDASLQDCIEWVKTNSKFDCDYLVDAKISVAFSQKVKQREITAIEEIS